MELKKTTAISTQLLMCCRLYQKRFDVELAFSLKSRQTDRVRTLRGPEGVLVCVRLMNKHWTIHCTCPVTDRDMSEHLAVTQSFDAGSLRGNNTIVQLVKKAP